MKTEQEKEEFKNSIKLIKRNLNLNTLIREGYKGEIIPLRRIYLFDERLYSIFPFLEDEKAVNFSEFIEDLSSVQLANEIDNYRKCPLYIRYNLPTTKILRCSICNMEIPGYLDRCPYCGNPIL